MWLAVKRIPSNAAFFTLAFLYVWLVTEPRLIYYGFGTIVDASTFATGWSFLATSVARPGGFATYLSGFLSQGYYYSWLGAAIIVLVGLGLSELARRHLVRAGCKGSKVLSTLPAIAFFVLCATYKHPLVACLAVSLGLLFSLAYELVAPARILIRVCVYGLVAASLFWLAGAGGLLVFSLTTIVHSALVRRDRWLAVGALPLSAAVVWALARYVFLLPPRQAFLVLTPLGDSATAGMGVFLQSLVFLPYGLVPLTIALVRLFMRLSAVKVPVSKAGKARRGLPAVLGKPMAMAAPLVLMAGMLGFGHERMGQAFVLSNYYGCEKQWAEILELARSLPPGQTNVYVNHDIVRALYHTGRLPYDMFEFPQTPQALLLTHETRESELTQLKLCDVFLELGQVNLAERLASELLATRGPLAHVLERLAWISIVKGQDRAARVYLKALGRNLLYHDAARSMLDGLGRGFSPQQAAYISETRSYMPDVGAAAGMGSVDRMLTTLLERNGRNRMAFEYLMAAYLLTGQVDKIVANVGRLDDLGYRTIPTLYEEAILIHFGLRGEKLDVTKFNMKPETIQRYIKFVQIRNAMQPLNRSATLNRLVREFGASYFFYFTFGRVGLS